MKTGVEDGITEGLSVSGQMVVLSSIVSVSVVGAGTLGIGVGMPEDGTGAGMLEDTMG